MTKRTSFRRPLVNCICRCTPEAGILILHPLNVHAILDATLERIDTTRSTGIIAAEALRTGRLLENTGHLPLALHLYGRAVRTIYFIDADRAENYYTFGPTPPNPHFRTWGARISDTDALDVAAALDALCLRMGFRGYAHQCRRVRVDYEHLFRSVYSACL